MFKNPINSPSCKAIIVINNSLKASLANKATFPDHVKAIAEVGVIGYRVDLLQHTATYLFNNNLTHVEQFPVIEEKPSANFSSEEIKAAILAVQTKAIDYLTFLKRIVAAGTLHYEVDITEQKVTYTGGEQKSHVELFPGAKPAIALKSDAEPDGVPLTNNLTPTK